MFDILMTINSVLWCIAAVFLVYVVGKTIITLLHANWLLLLGAIALMLFLTATEIIFAAYSG